MCVVVRVDNLVAASGLPPVRFHDLRHITATLMLAAGASIKEIQDSLGHASYNMTADIYTAVLEELKRTTAEATTKLIPRRPHQAA
jgi:integrase